jgi:uncharacterized protein YjbI with pentapeptide repeats
MLADACATRGGIEDLISELLNPAGKVTTLHVGDYTASPTMQEFGRLMDAVIGNAEMDGKLESFGDLHKFFPYFPRGQTMPVVEIKKLAKAIGCHPALKEVSLYGLEISTKRLAQLLFPALQNIENVNLGRPGADQKRRFTPDGVQGIVDLLLNSKIKHLGIEWGGLTEDLAEVLSDGTRGNTTLVSLDLSNNKIGDWGLAALMEDEGIAGLQRLDLTGAAVELGGANGDNTEILLGGLSNLTSLCLNQNKLMEPVLEMLLTKGFCLNLKELSLEAVNLTHVSMHMVISYLHSNTRLERLDIGQNDLRGASIVSLKDALWENTTLKRLSVDHTRMGLAGLEAMAGLACTVPSLTHITASRCLAGVSGNHARLFADSIKKSPNLRFIDISGCQLQECHMQVIAQALLDTPRYEPVTVIVKGHSTAWENKANLRDALMNPGSGYRGIDVPFLKTGSSGAHVADVARKAVAKSFTDILFTFALGTAVSQGEDLAYNHTLSPEMLKMILDIYLGQSLC